MDYDAAGGVVGVEFLGVSAGVDLAGVPERDTVGRLLSHLDVKSRSGV